MSSEGGNPSKHLYKRQFSGMGPYTILVIVFRHNKDSFQVYQLLSYGMSCVAVVTVYTSAPLRFTEYSHQWNCLCAWVAMTLSRIKGWDYVPVDNCCIIDGVYRDEREQLSRLVYFFFIHSSFIFTLHPFLFLILFLCTQLCTTAHLLHMSLPTKFTLSNESHHRSPGKHIRCHRGGPVEN